MNTIIRPTNEDGVGLILIAEQPYAIYHTGTGDHVRLMKCHRTKPEVYDVGEDHGRLVCTCGDFIFRRHSIGSCKHIRAVEELAILNTSAVDQLDAVNSPDMVTFGD